MSGVRRGVEGRVGGIVGDVGVIAVQKINGAYERMLRSGVKYRFVVDMASLR